MLSNPRVARDRFFAYNKHSVRCIRQAGRVDLGKLVLYTILENFGYRKITTLWRIMAIWPFLRTNTEWGDMERRGFSPAKIMKKV